MVPLPQWAVFEITKIWKTCPVLVAPAVKESHWFLQQNILNLSFDFQRGLSWPGQMSLTEPTSVWCSQLCLIGVCFSNFLCLKHALAQCLLDLPLFHIHMKWEVQMQMHFPHLKLAKHRVPKFQEMLPLNALITFGIETLEWIILAQTSNMVDYC